MITNVGLYGIGGLLGLIFHEASHAIVTLAFGLKIRKVGICWKGIYVKRQSGTPVQNTFIALAGPLAHFILVAISWGTFPDVALGNLILGVVNLLPIRGSDGWNIIAYLHAEGREA
jgi:Zn-dependent protease